MKQYIYGRCWLVWRLSCSSGPRPTEWCAGSRLWSEGTRGWGLSGVSFMLVKSGLQRKTCRFLQEMSWETLWIQLKCCPVQLFKGKYWIDFGLHCANFRLNPNICKTNWTKFFLQIVELKTWRWSKKPFKQILKFSTKRQV